MASAENLADLRLESPARPIVALAIDDEEARAMYASAIVASRPVNARAMRAVPPCARRPVPRTCWRPASAPCSRVFDNRKSASDAGASRAARVRR